MNYDDFRSFRNELLSRRSPRRLDCMNPEVALAHLRPAVANPPPASLAATVERWSQATGVAMPASLVAGSGIRSLLEGLFPLLADQIETLWLPEDVYPVYWQLSSPVRRRGFATLPEVDWSVLDASGPRDTLLLPSPMAPLGRSLSPDESSRLVAWLAAHPARRLILDGAYCFAGPIDRQHDPRLRGGQTIALWSLSKPWISRGLLGLASVPAAMREPLQSRVTMPEPSQLGRAAASMAAAPELPALLAARFAAAWTRLTPAIRAACPSWSPPDGGYFSMLPIGFEELLQEHELLAIPATVFGSRRERLSIASCLYDIELHDGRGHS